jgi:hypothetical protein
LLTEQVATIVIGQTFVDVPHGSFSIPTVDDIAVVPHDNLGGRSWWIDTIGSVNFRLNISSADGGAAHEFGWRLLSETYEPAPGRYGILVAVKNLCLIDLAETAFDAQLDTMIKAADNIINTTLKRCGTTTPLVAPDDIIHDISNYLAAGLFKQKDVPDEKVHSFYTVGMNLLQEYVAANYPAAATPGNSTPVTNQSLAYGVGLAT